MCTKGDVSMELMTRVYYEFLVDRGQTAEGPSPSRFWII